MPDIAIQLTYTLRFASPFHIGAGYGLAGFVDATAVRRHDGNLYIPGSSIKGRARWHLTQVLARPWGHDLKPCSAQTPTAICTLCNLFGSTELPSGLYFGDAMLMQEDNLAMQAASMLGDSAPELGEHEQMALRQLSQVERRTQVSISRRRRVSREELLFVTELGQAGLSFRGRVEGIVPTQGRTLPLPEGQKLPDGVPFLPADLGWLIAALRLVEQVGGRKSRGLGHCRVTIEKLLAGPPGGSLERIDSHDWILLALRKQEASQ